MPRLFQKLSYSRPGDVSPAKSSMHLRNSTSKPVGTCVLHYSGALRSCAEGLQHNRVAGASVPLPVITVPMTSTTACMLETTLTFHSMRSPRLRGLRGSAQPLISRAANATAQATNEPTIVHGDAPHSPPFGVAINLCHMSIIVAIQRTRDCALFGTRRPTSRCAL